MATEIDEPITVGAIFSRGAMRPIWFTWNNREIKIREITFMWKTQDGKVPVLHFSASDGQGLYEIAFNGETMEWRILTCE